MMITTIKLCPIIMQSHYSEYEVKTTMYGTYIYSYSYIYSTYVHESKRKINYTLKKLKTCLKSTLPLFTRKDKKFISQIRKKKKLPKTEKNQKRD